MKISSIKDQSTTMAFKCQSNILVYVVGVHRILRNDTTYKQDFYLYVCVCVTNQPTWDHSVHIYNIYILYLVVINSIIIHNEMKYIHSAGTVLSSLEHHIISFGPPKHYKLLSLYTVGIPKFNSIVHCTCSRMHPHTSIFTGLNNRMNIIYCIHSLFTGQSATC